MRKSLVFAAMLLCFLASCSTEYEPKEIESTSREFTGGELAKLIEVSAFDDGELTFSETDGAIPKQTIMLKLKLELKKERADLKEVDAQDIHFTGLLSVAIVKVEDKNGAEIMSLEIKDSDMLKLKKLLQGSEGDDEDIVFMGEYHNSKDAPKWFESAAKYTPDLTANITVGGKEISKPKPAKEEDVEEDVEEGVEEADTKKVSSEEVEEALAEYEDLVDRFYKCFKKAKKGDMDAAAEYDEIMKEAQVAGEKMAKYQRYFDSSQMRRYNRLYKKAMDAISDNDD